MSIHLHGTTKLSAVNTILAGIGDTPIVTLDGPLNGDVALALNTLEETSRTIQSEGWACNTEHDVELVPDSLGNILVPPNILRPLFRQTGSRVITIHGTRLYDLTNKTYTFDEGVTATVVYLLNWENLTETLRQYITAKASRIFQVRAVGSDFIDHHLGELEMAAKINALDEDASMAQYNQSEVEGTIFNSFTAAKALGR